MQRHDYTDPCYADYNYFGPMPEGRYYLASDADARIEQLAQQLAFANDAAAKGEAARLAAAGMEEHIEQLERALKSCMTVLQLEQHQRDKFINASNDAIVEAEKALALMESGSHD